MCWGTLYRAVWKWLTPRPELSSGTSDARRSHPRNFRQNYNIWSLPELSDLNDGESSNGRTADSDSASLGSSPSSPEFREAKFSTHAHAVNHHRLLTANVFYREILAWACACAVKERIHLDCSWLSRSRNSPPMHMPQNFAKPKFSTHAHAHAITISL